MKYERPAYLDPSIKTAEKRGMFGAASYKVPVPNYPISIKENFQRAANHNNPLWIPNSSCEVDTAMLSMVNGMPEADFTRKERHDFTDWFGVEWMFVPEAGGPMLKPGTQFMDDITEWEKKVKFPEMKDYDFAGMSAKWLARTDPEKVKQVNIGLGCTERLVALMGGYTDAMLAMAMEPEACHDFLMAFAEWDCKVVDELCKYIPLDFVTYHDDWGTERDTFFSEKYMEDIVFEPTKLLFSHIREKGIVLQHHCCGHIERFLPYMAQLGANYTQLQARANNIAAYKAKYGTVLGFEVGIHPEEMTKEGVIKAVHEMVDTYGATGGVFTNCFLGDPELLWLAIMEAFCYSREFYDKEQGRA